LSRAAQKRKRNAGAIEIRRVRLGDEALFAKVAPEVFDTRIPKGRLAEYLADPNTVLLVALANGEVIAQAAAMITRHPSRPRELWIDEVGVTPKFQRQGVATALLQALLEIARSLKCRAAWVATENDNEKARGLYRSLKPKEEQEEIVVYVYDTKAKPKLKKKATPASRR
jgi:aminoglycoside 6'-N-acetyltransferase I